MAWKNKRNRRDRIDGKDGKSRRDRRGRKNLLRYKSDWQLLMKYSFRLFLQICPYLVLWNQRVFLLDTSFWQIFGLQLKIYVCSYYEFLRENIKNLQGIVTLLVVCCIGNGGAQLQLKLYGLHSHYLLGPITLSLLYCFLNYWILGVQKRKTRLDIFVIQFHCIGNKEL